MRRVVITGIGINSVVGCEKKEFWENILNGKNGIINVDKFDTSQYVNKLGGQICKNNIDEYLSVEEKEKYGECAQIAVASSRMALEDAGIKSEIIDHYRAGVALGTTDGEAQCLQHINDSIYSKSRIDKMKIRTWCENYPCSNISAAVSEAIDFRGSSIMTSNACAAANFAVGYMFDLIKKGDLDYAIAGGADVFSRIDFTGFRRLLAVTPDKVRPFDKNRKGMMVSEGSAVVFLEELTHALNRNANIYCEILGYGVSNDAYHMTTPHPEAEGVLLAMNNAIKHSGCKKEEIDYVSLHGTGTKANDNAEMLAMQEFFKETVSKVKASSIKGAIGHSMGAASAIELVVCALILKYGKIPPTMNLLELDDKCKFDLISNEYIDYDVRILMNNAYAFGGSNSSLIMKQYVEK